MLSLSLKSDTWRKNVKYRQLLCLSSWRFSAKISLQLALLTLEEIAARRKQKRCSAPFVCLGSKVHPKKRYSLRAYPTAKRHISRPFTAMILFPMIILELLVRFLGAQKLLCIWPLDADGKISPLLATFESYTATVDSGQMTSWGLWRFKAVLPGQLKTSGDYFLPTCPFDALTGMGTIGGNYSPMMTSTWVLVSYEVVLASCW